MEKPKQKTFLYIVGTPIGNLDDISMRAMEILHSCDFVIAEDTRQTNKLLLAYNIEKKLVSFHAHSTAKDLRELVEKIRGSYKVALATDAGTPCIADPGGLLIEYIVDKNEPIEIIPIPGVSSITTALSVAGFKANQFVFMGYVPKKQGLNKFFKQIDDAKETIVFFETPHRIEKTIEKLSKLKKAKRRIVICRELTKMYETIYRVRVENVITALQKDEIKGEFVIVIEGN